MCPQIFVEIERARLTRKLAAMKESEGQIAEAADILQEVAVVSEWVSREWLPEIGCWRGSGRDSNRAQQPFEALPYEPAPQHSSGLEPCISDGPAKYVGSWMWCVGIAGCVSESGGSGFRPWHVGRWPRQGLGSTLRPWLVAYQGCAF